MKLDKSQISALANKISIELLDAKREAFEKYKKSKEFNDHVLQVMKDNSIKEVFALLENHENVVSVTVRIPSGPYRDIMDLSSSDTPERVRKQISENAFQVFFKSVPSQQDIENTIVVETIGQDDVAQIISAVKSKYENKQK